MYLRFVVIFQTAQMHTDTHSSHKPQQSKISPPSYCDVIVKIMGGPCSWQHPWVLSGHGVFEDGAPFVIDGRTYHFRGTVTVPSADNPASASLGEFKKKCICFSILPALLKNRGGYPIKGIIIQYTSG